MGSLLLLRQIPATLHTVQHSAMTINHRLLPSYNNDLCAPDSGLESWSPDLYSNNSFDSSSTPSDLVSLAWLQKGDIIQIAPLDGEDDSQSGFPPSDTPVPPPLKFESISKLDKLNEDFSKCSSTEFRSVNSTTNRLSISTSTASLQRPASIEYCSPQNSIDSPQLQPPTAIGNFGPASQGLTKPNYSYTHLIFMAIESTAQKCMTVNQIYNWCESNFPFYKHAGAGWKNSLRHNLSINKSFKRLPRDSRGPGRGAFWTVEPRERATLLDAIKRNPWNFHNMAALMAAQSEFNGHPSFMEFTSPQYFGVRRLGLTQSAPGQLLRAHGLGQNELTELHFDRMGNLLTTTNGLQICPTYCVNGAFTPALASSPAVENSMNSPNELNNLDTGCEKSVLPEWSQEEEEKYLCSLRSLAETVDHPVTNGEDELRPCEHIEDVPASMVPAEIKLSTTKQRRKSRLQPTRIVEDSYACPPSFDVVVPCNECKENAATGCDACHTKRSLLLSRSSVHSNSFRERALADVVNALDSDQEHGPAGGPAMRKFRKATNHSADTTMPKLDPDEETREVYVTPAPYIDHEYSHCQTQLRGAEDNRMVNRYNSNYCNEMMKRLSRSRAYTRRGSMFKMWGTNERRSRFVETDSGDENYSFDESEFSDNEVLLLKRSSGGMSKSSLRVRPKRRLKSLQAAPRSRRYKPDPYSSISNHRLGWRNGSKARRQNDEHVGKRSIVTKVSRRSQRVIKAPKRPYDDFETPSADESQLPPEHFESSAPSDFESMTESDETVIKIGNHKSNQLKRQPKRRSSKRATTGRSGSDPALSDESSNTDEELLYLHYASKRQQLGRMSRFTSRSSTPSPIISPSRIHATNRASSKHRHCDKNVTWGQSRVVQHQHGRYWDPHYESDAEPDIKEANGIIEHSPEVEDCVEEIIEEEPIQQTTVEAAQLLLGISQMQSFRRQSGYVSLDSSGTSETLGSITESSNCKKTE